MKTTGHRAVIFAHNKMDAAPLQDALKEIYTDVKVSDCFENLLADSEKNPPTLIFINPNLSANESSRLQNFLRDAVSPPYPIVCLDEKNECGVDIAGLIKLDFELSAKNILAVLEMAMKLRKQTTEIAKLKNSLQASNRHIADADRAKTQFLANMSHEIRTPLGAVMGFAELMTDPTTNPVDRKIYLDALNRNGQILSVLIDDILDLSNIESGRMEIQLIDVAYTKLLLDVVRSLKAQAHSRHVRVSIQSSPEIPYSIKTDAVRLKQILVNIIGNAIKFTDHGAVSIRSFIDESGKILVAEVQDSGIGISAEHQRNLFKPFSQVDESTTRNFGGSGLGLILSRQLARAMGGDVVILQSELGKGTTIQVRINLPDLAQQSTDSSARPKRKGTPQIQGLKVLLVEDAVDNQVLISRILSSAGAEVSVACDGLEGITMALKNDFHAVLMDIQMPRLGGQEATAELRKRGFNKPIIALTAHALKDDRDRCLQAGCDAYLTKPVDRVALIDTLSNLTKNCVKNAGGRFH